MPSTISVASETQKVTELRLKRHAEILQCFRLHFTNKLYGKQVLFLRKFVCILSLKRNEN